MNQKLVIKEEQIINREEAMRNEFKVLIKSLNDMVNRLDEKISNIDFQDQNNLMKKSILEVTKKQMRHDIPLIFDPIRTLLEKIQLDWITFRQAFQDQSNSERVDKNDQLKDNVSKNGTIARLKSNGYSVFESRMSKHSSSVESLEDNIESQELNLLIKSREQIWTSFSSSLLKPSQLKPQSVFVQSLIQLQAAQENSFRLGNAYNQDGYQNTLASYTRLSDFYYAKRSLQKEIGKLRKELGLTMIDLTCHL